MRKTVWISALLAVAGLAGLVGLAGLAAVAPAQAVEPGPSLSIFKPDGKGISWIRQEALAPQKTQLIARFNEPNVMPDVAWSADGRQALVQLTRATGEEKPMLWHVAVPTGKVGRLPLPSPGDVEEFGYDARGNALVLTRHEIPARKDRQGTYLTFQGKRYAVDTDREGIPILAHAFRLNPAGKWTLIETKVSDTGWDMAQGVSALEANRTLGYRTMHELRSYSRGDSESDKKLVAHLTAAAPEIKTREGEWQRFATPAGPFFVWCEAIEFLLSAPIVVLKVDGKLKKLPGLAADFGDTPHSMTFIAPQVHGQHLLISKSHTGAFPHLYDVKTGRLLYQDRSALGAVFWPK